MESSILSNQDTSLHMPKESFGPDQPSEEIQHQICQLLKKSNQNNHCKY